MSSFPPTLFPSDEIRLKSENQTDFIFDTLRKKWLVLTSEEWVRQHLLLHIHRVLQYPVSSIAIEKVVDINGMPKRFDALIYVHSKPAILIECKAPKVALTEEVFHQACRYNTQINAPLTVLFNGLQLIVASVNTTTGKVGFLKDIPSRSEW